MSITAKEFDERFEKEDISDLLDFEAAKSIKELKKPTMKKINIGGFFIICPGRDSNPRPSD